MSDPSLSRLQGALTRLRERLAAREARVGIVGLGYVGLPLAIAFHQAGLFCLGFDVDDAKIEALARGRSYIRHIGPGKMKALAASPRFDATTDFSRIGEVDAVIICVPTPLTVHRDPDMRFVEATARAIAPHLRPGQLVTLESTTYPMTSEGLLLQLLEAGSGLVVGESLALAYSPEREDPGNADHETGTIPKIVGADDGPSGDMAEALYAVIIATVVRVPSMRVAEAVKLTENIFRSVNIALVNELKIIFDRMDVDIFEVIDAAKTKPFGYMPFYPGPGLGGHCIPIDPFYLTWKAREFGINTRFIELAGEINDAMPDWVIARLTDALSDRLGKPIRGARILVVGLAYKRNVDDMRESPSVRIIEKLEARGAVVGFHDPFIPVIPTTRDHSALAGRRSIDWSAATLAAFDAALIATDHEGVDLRLLLETVPLVVDTRNATASLAPEFGGRIVRA